MNTYSIAQRLLIAFCILSALCVLALKLYFLNTSFILSDDAWYAVLLRDRPSQALVSQFYYLYGSVFGGDILSYRLLHVISYLLSLSVLSLALTQFFSEKGIGKAVLAFSLFLSFTFYEQGCLAPSYLNMNSVAVNFACGFFLLGLKHTNHRYFFILSGLFFASLFIIMITNSVLYFLSFLLLLFTRDKLKNALYLMMGGFLFLGIYFTFFQDISLYINNFFLLFADTTSKAESSYGIMFLIKWLFKSLLFIFKYNLLGGLAIYLLYLLYARYLRKYSFTFISLSCVVGTACAILLLYTRPELLISNYAAIRELFDSTFYLIIILNAIVGFSLILICVDKSYTIKQRLILCYFLFIPLFLSFGTNTLYSGRSGMYLYFFAPIIYFCYFSKCRRDLVLLLIGFAAIAISLYSFALSMIRPNFFYQNRIECNTPMSSQRIFLEAREVAMLDHVQAALKESDHVLVDFQWGAYYVSNSQLLDYTFRINPHSTTKLLNEHYPTLENVVLIALDPYSVDTISDFIVELSSSRKVSFTREKYGSTLLYRL